VVVEMEEGVRLLSQVVDCPPDELEIGAAVTVDFLIVTPGDTVSGGEGAVALPVFRRE